MGTTSHTDDRAPSPSAGGTERLLKRREAAAYLGVSLRWLENRTDIEVADLAGPASGRPMLRYRKSVLDDFVARQSKHLHDGRR